MPNAPASVCNKKGSEEDKNSGNVRVGLGLVSPSGCQMTIDKQDPS